MENKVLDQSTAAAAEPVRVRVTWLMALPFPIRSLTRRWRGLLGMVIGVGISLSVVMTLLAMSQGSIDIYTSDYLKSSADLYVITQGGTLIPILPSDTPGTITEGRATLERLRALPGVNAAVGVLNWSLVRERPGPRRTDEPAELVATLGVDGDSAAVPGMLVMESGRWLRRSNEIVVGSKLATEKIIVIGDEVRLAGRDFTVVGIGRLRGFGFAANSLAYLDYRALRDRAGAGDLLNVIALDAASVPAVSNRIERIGDLEYLTPADLVVRAEKANETAVVLYWIFDILALAVGALFVGNMLSRSVAERRIDFATMRAIGISTRTILLTVASEALLICLVAAGVGMAVSLLMGAWINAVLAPAYGIESFYTAEPSLFLLVFGLALGLGLVSGLLPARGATRVDPVEVLRDA